MKMIQILSVLAFSLQSISFDSDDSDVIVEEIEIRMAEIKKLGEILVTATQVESTPDWNGVDYENLPVSMKKAVDVATKFLITNGCTSNNYHLKECSLLRMSYRKESHKWYWKVTFVDQSNPILNYPPFVTIPVLFTGKVPKVILKPMKDNK